MRRINKPGLTQLIRARTTIRNASTQQKPESPTVTLIWNACKYKIHKLHQRYIRWWSFCTLYLLGLSCCTWVVQRTLSLWLSPTGFQVRSRAGRWSWTLTPEEITSREVELDPHPRRDHEQGGGAGPSPQKRSRAGRWSWTLTPEEITSREVELDPPHPGTDHEQGGGAGLRKLDFFRFRLFLNSGATDIVFVTLPKHGSWNSNCAVYKSLGNGEGGHRLNASIVLAAVRGLSGLFRAVSAVEPSFFRPAPPPPHLPCT